jgi:hypothetical protein
VKFLSCFGRSESVLICVVFLLLPSCLNECSCVIHYYRLASRPLYICLVLSFLRERLKLKRYAAKHSESIDIHL